MPNRDHIGSHGRLALDEMVCGYLCQGYSAKEIARLIGKWPSGRALTHEHVYNVIEMLRRRLGLRTMAELTYRFGLDPDLIKSLRGNAALNSAKPEVAEV